MRNLFFALRTPRERGKWGALSNGLAHAPARGENCATFIIGKQSSSQGCRSM